MKKLLLFQINNQQFGLDLPCVKGIHKPESIFEEYPDEAKAVQNASIECNHMLLYDLAVILGLPGASAESREKKIIVTGWDDQLAAFRVDRVDPVVLAEDSQIEPLPPIFMSASLACFPRILKQPDKLILILNPGGIASRVRDKSESPETILSEKTDFRDRISPELLALADDPEKLENTLTHMMHNDIITETIVRHIHRIASRTVETGMRNVKKALGKTET